MIYKKYSLYLLFRILLLLLFLSLLAYSITIREVYLTFGAAVFAVYSVYDLYRFTSRKFAAMDDFFESVRYRDFSRWYVENKGASGLRSLHAGFNEVNRTIREINSEKDVQYVYLQKILEMIDVGIIAYNMNSGEVLWANDAIRSILDFPSFKNISFVARRNPLLYKEIFEVVHPEATSVSLPLRNEKTKVLISETVFKIREDSFKLIVLQNIEDTLNQNEAEAWKKLLSVMTHEIMNSIAPISSLAETLQQQVQKAAADPATNSLDLEDLDSGISSIKKRSEGLIKFAKTYRSLNKVTYLDLQKVYVRDLFENLERLMLPSLNIKRVQLDLKLKITDLEILVDSYLIEQVLINLLLNAIDAVKEEPEAKIQISADRNSNGKTIIKVADNGKGVPADIINTIFIPFFSTKKNGSGIGLSLSKEIMMLHKGKIQLKSEEGKGTVISLLF